MASLDKKNQDDAVSPVIAIMLMLVVTIIIAAVVSSFAGGLAKSQDRIPQLTFDGKYSIKNGIELTHTGGDSINPSEVEMTMRPGTGFGVGIQANVNTINKTSLTDSTGTKFWKGIGGKNVGNFSSTNSTLYANVWSVGSTAYILPPLHLNGNLQHESNGYTCWNNSVNLGNSISVQIVNRQGQLIGKGEIKIVP